MDASFQFTFIGRLIEQPALLTGAGGSPVALARLLVTPGKGWAPQEPYEAEVEVHGAKAAAAIEHKAGTLVGAVGRRINTGWPVRIKASQLGLERLGAPRPAAQEAS